jgi:hypothetical protein
MLVVLPSLRAWRGRLVAMVTTMAVAAAIFAAGRGYVWCVPMQRAMSVCCRTHAHAPRAGGQSARVAERPCCERRALPSLPTSELRRADVGVPPAVVRSSAAVAAPTTTVRRSSADDAVTHAFEHRRAAIRAGPLSERLAMLVVYRC